MTLLVAGLVAAIAAPRADDRTSMDLLRVGPGGNRIYVQAELPDGSFGLFLVDTGASVSVLSAETAERLGLPVEHGYGFVEGLGGRAPFDHAVVPSLRLGSFDVDDVDVAVGVRGVPERAGFVPLDGILGTNVWARFVMKVDYRQDRLELFRPGSVRLRRGSAPMALEGGHVFTTLSATTETGTSLDLLVQLDTGAGDLLIDGPAPELEVGHPYTVGVEPIYGIGASEIMPPSEFLVETRRVPLEQAELGGRTVHLHGLQARWVGWEEATGMLGGAPHAVGLAGHELMAGHVAWFDFPRGAFALKAGRRGPSRDLHEVVLAQDLARFGDDPTRYLSRAEWHAALDGMDDAAPGAHLDEASRLARQFLDSGVGDESQDAQARTLLAGIHRFRGDLDAAWEALSGLSPEELVETGEIVAAVNGLLLGGSPDGALTLAEGAVAAVAGRDSIDGRIEWSAALVSRADAWLGLGQLEDARADLLDAAEIVENPDAHLLRRSRVAIAQDDRDGALALVRRLVQLYPSEGTFLWFYALLVDETTAPGSAATFEADLEAAMARLHPPYRPLDFQLAARVALGQADEARALLREGLQRDCHDLPLSDASRDNCVAWYQALAHVELDDALVRIDRALASEGPRSDFLDTKAMVHHARGEHALAWEAAREAARLSPDDIYMLWQVERLAARLPAGG